MRVIAGRLRSRIFKAPRGHRTHPMGEKIRAAIFNALGDIEGLTVLDAYSGSGSLAIESISRGAKRATAVDSDKRAYKALTENIEALGLEESLHAVKANITTWAQNVDDMFDIVFVDPPYQDVNPLHLENIAERLEVGGLYVLSHPAVFRPRFKGREWNLESAKVYANANISIFRKLK